MNNAGFDREQVGQTKVTASKLAELVKLVDAGTINKGTGLDVLNEMWSTGADAAKIVEDKGLAQVSDTGAISAIVAEVLTTNDAMVQRYLDGEEKLFGALVGLCMKALKGKGNPAMVNSLLKEQLAAKKN